MPLSMILKKLVGRLLFPVPVTLLLLGIGAWLILSRKSSPRRKAVGKWLLLGGFVYLLTISVLGTFLLERWERQYPVFTMGSQFDASPEYVIAVAGSMFIPDNAIPAESRFNHDMLLRLGEAARIARMFDMKSVRYRIVVSQQSPLATAEQRLTAVRAYFAAFGIAPERVALVDGSLNTRQEVLAFGKYPGSLILISNAFHVPRLMLLARKYGLNAIPAPVGVPGKLQYRIDLLDFIPSASNINDFQTLIYELLGMVDVKLF